ncbi:MAG TPA: hypothetical protein DEA08_24895 [Planctomycetes bacterium]|nr:hypothetical protein [Planctomycetota bacterium]
MRRAGWVLALATAALTGCAGERLGQVEHEVADLRVEVERLRGRVDQLAGITRRLEALEASLGAPRPKPASERERDVERDASLSELRVRVSQLEQALREGAGVGGGSAGAEAGGGGEGPRVLPLPKLAAPPAGSLVEILALDGGDVLLGRAEGKPWRLHLAGVSAPRRARDYERDKALQTKHEAGFGRLIRDDQAWQRARDFTAQLVEGEARWKLSYPPGGPAKDPAGGLRVVLVREGAASVNEQLVAAGFALAEDEAYRGLERAARAGRKGLFSP